MRDLQELKSFCEAVEELHNHLNNLYKQEVVEFEYINHYGKVEHFAFTKFEDFDSKPEWICNLDAVEGFYSYIHKNKFIDIYNDFYCDQFADEDCW